MSCTRPSSPFPKLGERIALGRSKPLRVAFLTLFALGTAGNAYAHQPDSEEEDLILEDEPEGGEAEAEADLVVEEDTKPKVSEDELTGDLGFLEDDKEKGGDPIGGSKDEGEQKKSKLSKEELEKQYERIITIVSWQPMLNVFKKRDDKDGKTIHRWDIQPQIGLSINDPYVRHYALGLEVNWWATNRMAIGVTGTGFWGAKTNNYYQQNRQQRVVLAANRFLWQASANFLYEFGYGKFAIFNRKLLHWESYVQLGGGAIQTQVIPRFQALHDSFSNVTWQANLAIGARFYLPDNEFVSINGGVRTWYFQDLLEPEKREPDNPQLSPADAAKQKAKEDGITHSYNSVFFLGVSFYFPTSFEYSTRR